MKLFSDFLNPFFLCVLDKGYNSTEGRKEGLNEKAVASARNLLAMKLGTHEQIAKAVGLPLEKIEELATDLAKEATLQ